MTTNNLTTAVRRALILLVCCAAAVQSNAGLYLVGSHNSWGAGIEMATTDSKTYVLANYELPHGTAFRFSTEADVAAGDNMGAEAALTPAYADRAAATLADGRNNFIFLGESGNYNIVVNLTDMTVKVCPIPRIYIYDSAAPYVQVYSNSGAKTRGVSDAGDRLTEAHLTTIPDNTLEWYTLPIEAPTYPVKVTVQHLGTEMNQNPVTTPSEILQSWGAYPEPVGYFTWGIEPDRYTVNADDEDLYFVASTTEYKFYPYGRYYASYYYSAMMDFFWVGYYDDAKNFRRAEVNLLKEEPYEPAPVSSEILYVHSGQVCFTGKTMEKQVNAYGHNWWRETNLEDDDLRYTITDGTNTGVLNNVGSPVWVRWQDGQLVEVDEATRQSWNRPPADVVLHIEVTDQLTRAMRGAEITSQVWRGLNDAGGSRKEPTITTTPDGKQWYTFTAEGQPFASFRLITRNDHLTSPILSHLAGEHYYTWEIDSRASGQHQGKFTDMTRFETQMVETLPDCAVAIDGHNYIQYRDYNGWNADSVYVAFDGAWPGHKMTLVGNSLGNGVYLLDLTAAGLDMPEKVIFNNGKQAVGADGEWHSSELAYTDCGVYDHVGCLGSDRDLAFVTSRYPSGQSTTIADDVVALFYDKRTTYGPSAGILYVKDDDKSLTKSYNRFNKVDYMSEIYQRVDTFEVSGLADYREIYDQSTWAQLYQATTDVNLKAYEGRRIPGGHITGYRITNDLDVFGNNPRFMVTAIDIAPEDCPLEEYLPNMYIPAHFNERYVNDGMNVDAPYFFVAPKAMEYALIEDAVFDGSGFSISDRDTIIGTNGEIVHIFNPADLEGGVSVKWDLLQNENMRQDYRGEMYLDGTYSPYPDGVLDPPQELKEGYTYRFHAIIKRFEFEHETVEGGWPYNVVGDVSGDAPRRAPEDYPDTLGFKDHALSYYEIYPIDLEATESVVTAVEDRTIAATPVDTEYYDVSGHRLGAPTDGVTIVVTRYSNGATTSKKVVR